MTQRLATLALAALLAVPAASAFAQGYDAPRLEGATGSRSFFGMPAWVDQARTRDAATTGSIGPRDIDASAKGGNAAQPSRLVPQYGNTAGGPAE